MVWCQECHQNKEWCPKCGDWTHLECFQCPAKSSSVKLVTSLDTLPAFVIRKSKFLSSQGSQRCINYKHGQYMSKITNLTYRLKSHHTRNLCLRARLDTCADVNIMPASVYRLVFKDADMKKLGPSKLEIGTHTTYTVKIVGSGMFYLVHPDTNKLVDVTFFVALM